MLVQPVAAPAATRRAGLTSPTDALFVAVGRELAAFTHRQDDGPGYALPGCTSLWLAVPMDRDLMIAAWMVRPADVTTEELAEASDDQVREWAICAVLFVGVEDAQEELRSPAFASGYAYAAPGAAAVFRHVSARIDRAFGVIPSAPAPAPVVGGHPRVPALL